MNDACAPVWLEPVPGLSDERAIVLAEVVAAAVEVRIAPQELELVSSLMAAAAAGTAAETKALLATDLRLNVAMSLPSELERANDAKR